MSRIFALNDFSHHYMINKSDFEYYIRYYLNLERPLSSSMILCLNKPTNEVCEICDRCSDDSNAIPITPTADHLAFCTSCYGTRNDVHNALRDFIASFVRSLGIESKIEPSMFSVLLGEYKRDHCDALFPRRAQGQAHERAKKIAKLLLDRKDAPLYGKYMIDKVIATEMASIQTDKDAKGRRLDVTIKSPIPTKEDFWIDVVCPHTTQTSAIDNTHKFFVDLAINTLARGLNPKSDKSTPSSHTGCSGVVLNAVKRKEQDYGILMDIAHDQTNRSLRPVVPSLSATAITHTGELSAPFFDLANWIAFMGTQTKECQSLTDGVSTHQRKSRIRNAFLDGVCAKMASYYGKLLRSGGLPSRGFKNPAPSPKKCRSKCQTSNPPAHGIHLSSSPSSSSSSSSSA